jgi:hypothetical protein
MLKTPSLWYEVRVTYILPQEPRDGAEKSGPPRFRVGLIRLREIVRPDRDGIASLPGRVLRRLFPRESAGTLSGLALTVMIFATVMLSLALTSRGRLNFGPWAWWPSSPGAAYGAEVGAGSTSAATEAAANLSLARLYVLIHRLPPEEALLVPALAAELRLSDDQLAELQRLHETTRAALQNVERTWPNESRQEHADRRAIIRDAAARQALLLVTGQQRKRWEQLAQ